jgi:hypothetical protein
MSDGYLSLGMKKVERLRAGVRRWRGSVRGREKWKRRRIRGKRRIRGRRKRRRRRRK